MKVSYERLFNLGNYNNERIVLEDDVQPEESPHEAYQRLRALVYEMAELPDPKNARSAPARKTAPATSEGQHDAA